MNFEGALGHLRAGQRLFRKGWNAPNQYIFLVAGSTFEVNRAPLDQFFKPGTEVTYHPHIDLKCVDDTICVWNPWMLDLLADDWAIVV